MESVCYILCFVSSPHFELLYPDVMIHSESIFLFANVLHLVEFPPHSFKMILRLDVVSNITIRTTKAAIRVKTVFP